MAEEYLYVRFHSNNSKRWDGKNSEVPTKMVMRKGRLHEHGRFGGGGGPLAIQGQGERKDLTVLHTVRGGSHDHRRTASTKE